jgi:hypothetical protein
MVEYVCNQKDYNNNRKEKEVKKWYRLMNGKQEKKI